MRAISNLFGARITVAVALAAATVSLPAAAERLSLAERVAALEAQAQAGQGNLDLVNQLQALQTEVQQLNGLVEQLRHQLDEQKERGGQHKRAFQGGCSPPPAANWVARHHEGS